MSSRDRRFGFLEDEPQADHFAASGFANQKISLRPTMASCSREVAELAECGKVGLRGLEPPRLATLDPKSSASASSATAPSIPQSVHFILSPFPGED